MTLEKKLEALKKKRGDELVRLWNYAMKIPGLPRNLDYRAETLFGVVDEITAIASEYSCCKKGCSFCCHQSVVISTWEANRIADFLGKKIDQFTGIDLFDARIKQKDYIKKYSGQACPFLKNNLCSVYEVRPFTCRLHLSWADDSSPCDIKNNPGADVPYFNFEQLKLLLAMLFMQGDCKFADIREFFNEE